MVEEEEQQPIEVRALQSLGSGFDLTSDFRLKFTKGRGRLVVLDEQNQRDIAIPGASNLLHRVSKDIKCDKGDRIRFKSDLLDFNQMSELLNQRSSIQGKVPSGYFNAIFELSGAWMNDATDTKYLAFDGYYISLYNLHLTSPLALKAQETALRSMPDVVVATPGRMIDHLRNSQSVGLEDLAVLILDEADRLLELGFSNEIKELVRVCPKRRQTMLFSATMTEDVDELIKLSLTKPLRLSADPSTKRPAALTEEVVRIRRMREVNQEAVLFALCSRTFMSRVIIFSGTKQAAHRLKILFGLAGLKAAELHGNLTQVQRLDALELFRRQEVDFLIATDVAARGLDIIGVQTVINFACPRDLTSYVHRVGRTARAGREGYAVTFVTDNDRSVLKSIAKRAGSKLKSRIVAEQSISKWCQMIEQMEDQVSEVLQEESEERALRKAEMQMTKAENLIAHKEEIYSRPKRTWFATEKEKKLTAMAAKDSVDKDKKSGKVVLSAQQYEDKKLKEKRKREREKSLPRKKRRRLEAARESLEDENQSDEGGRSGKKEKEGTLLVDVGYRKAKAVKAIKKAQDAGKFVKKEGKTSKRPQRSQSRSEEMRDLFQSDMSENKQRKGSVGVGGQKKSKSSFKSKSRYKRK